MSEKLDLIKKLKERQEELGMLQNLFNPRFSTGGSNYNKYEISHTTIQMIGVLGVFLLIGLFIGYALKKQKTDTIKYKERDVITHEVKDIIEQQFQNILKKGLGV